MARWPWPRLAHAILSHFSCAQYRPHPLKIFHTEKQLAPQHPKYLLRKFFTFSLTRTIISL